MKLKSTILFLGILFPIISSATNYYVRPDSYTGTVGDGSSWDAALKFSTFYSNINKYQNGDVFYFSGGTYIPSSVTGINNGYTFIGGFDPSSAGTNNSVPSYPSTTPTIFSGDINGDGTPNAGDAIRILAFNTATADDSKTVTLQGLEFTNAFDGGYTNTQGALWFRNSGNVIVKNCRFYNNICTATSSDGMGGMALTSEYSTCHLIDCEFYNNSAVSRGGAIRLSSNSATKGKTTIERCSIHDNAVERGVGSAILFQQGVSLYIINSTIANNTNSGTTYNNGAIYSNGADVNYSRSVYVINSTIEGNSNNQILMTQGANLNMTNSIIASSADDGTAATAAINITGTTASELTSITSGGYNIIGSFVDGVEYTPSWQTNDATGSNNTSNSVFGTNTLNNGYIIPTTFAQGANLEQISNAVEGWNVVSDVNLTLDQLSNYRGDYSTNGAIAKIEKSKTVISVGTNKYATYFNQYGYTMPVGLTGGIITNANNSDLTIDYKYYAGAKVPANTALIIKGDNGEYNVTDLAPANLSDDINMLQGSMSSTTTTSKLTDALFYKLSEGTSGIGFYWGATDGAAFTSDANKAYLAVSSASSAKSYIIDFPTNIKSISTTNAINPETDNIYTINGIKVKNIINGHLFIINGKKKVIK